MNDDLIYVEPRQEAVLHLDESVVCCRTVPEAWLAWAQPGPQPLTRIRLARVEDGFTVDVTDGRFVDSDPVFTVDGLYLAFLSRRTFDPIFSAGIIEADVRNAWSRLRQAALYESYLRRQVLRDVRQGRACLQTVRCERQAPLERRYSPGEIARAGVMHPQPQERTGAAGFAPRQRLQLRQRPGGPLFGGESTVADSVPERGNQQCGGGPRNPVFKCAHVVRPV